MQRPEGLDALSWLYPACPPVAPVLPGSSNDTLRCAPLPALPGALSAAGLEPATYGRSVQLSFTRTEHAAGLEPATYRRSVQLSSTQTSRETAGRRPSRACWTCLPVNSSRRTPDGALGRRATAHSLFSWRWGAPHTRIDGAGNRVCLVSTSYAVPPEARGLQRWNCPGHRPAPSAVSSHTRLLLRPYRGRRR